MVKHKVKINISFKDLIPKYLNNRKNDIKDLLSFINEQNFENIKKIAHSIKGSGGMYGFDDLSFIAMNLEEEAISKNMDAIKIYVNELKEYIENLEVEYV